MKELVNQNIVARCYYAGNWAGTVSQIDEQNGKIKIENAHRLWNWQAKDGISLSEVAQNGVTGGKICKPVPFVWLNNSDCYELIAMSNEALKNISEHAKSF